jgi:transcriptional regulator with XRE-family HTH domain
VISLRAEVIVRGYNPVLRRRAIEAMKKARELSGWSMEEWASALDVSVELLQGIEDGKIRFDADLLFLAIDLCQQPVATVFGETQIYEVTLPELERQLDRLREPQELILGPQFYR